MVRLRQTNLSIQNGGLVLVFSDLHKAPGVESCEAHREPLSLVEGTNPRCAAGWI